MKTSRSFCARLLVFAGLLIGIAAAWAQPDYANAHWNPPACTKYYTSGNGHYFCVIHDMEGYYEASIALLNTCGTNEDEASVFYLVNGLQNGHTSSHTENDPSDPPAGDITQSIREQYWAWHVLCWNTWMLGTEHEGFVSDPAWYSIPMYQASASLQRHMCINWNIPMDRDHIIGHDEWQNATWTNWMGTNFPGIDTTCNNHTDPGVYWNWTYFMDLITGSNGYTGTYWDINGSTAGAGTTPTGTWSNFNTNWSSSSSGNIALGTWVGPNAATFCAGTDSLSSTYTISISQTQVVTALLVVDGFPTFSGGGIAWDGTNGFYTNYVAAGHTATFNTTITGKGAPDKWGAGTAFYNNASALYGTGYFTLNQGTIGVGNDAALGTNKFVIGDSTGTNLVTFESSSGAARTITNPITVNATNFTLGAGGSLILSGNINLGTTVKTIVVSNNSTFSGSLTNTAGLNKNGPSTLTFSGATTNTYSGATTVSGGTLVLSKTATNGSIPSAGVTITNGAILQLGSSNQISDSATMTLGGGTFATAGYKETLSTLKLTSNSVVDLGSGSTVLKFAASSGVTWTSGMTLAISNWSGSVNGGGAAQVFFGTTSSGITSSQLAEVQFANPVGVAAGTYPAKMLSSGEIVPVFTAPAITGLSPSTNVNIGGSAHFVVTASGTTPLSYNWFKGAAQLSDSGDISGSTTSNLRFLSAASGDTGSYSVVVANLAGAATSSVVTLSVLSGPVITQQPTNQAAECGSTVTLNVTASGGSLTYLWYQGASLVSSGTTANLVLAGVPVSATGSYDVVITNSYASVTSQVAVLTVTDTTPPALTLKGTTTTNVECHASFTDPGATANDSCAGSLTVVTTGSVNINATNVYVLTYSATDPSGNLSAATRIVHVVDTTKPVVTLTGAATTNVECTGTFSDPGATASDTCAGSLAVTTSGVVNVNTNNTYIVSYIATDPSGNSATNIRVVHVVDTTPPVVTLNGSPTMDVECSSVFTDPGATGNDACAGTLTVATSGTVNTSATNTFTLTYVATDPSGNSTTNTRTVNVVVGTTPVLTLLGPASTNVECTTAFTDPGATANVSCGTNLPITSAGNVNTSTTGAYTLTYTATNPGYNTTTNFRIVNVVDTTPPVVTLNGPATTNIECAASFTDPGATANDTCAGSVAVTTMGSANPQATGIYTVTYSATDPSGNTGISTCTVTVIDTTPPVLTLNGNAVTNIPQYASFADPGATANDACAGTLGVTTVGNVNFAALGAYILSYVAVDPSGNSATNTRTVNIISAVPMLGLFSVNNGQLSFNVSGVAGYNYAVQISTDLFNWVSIQTNVAPFMFTNTNSPSDLLQVYRAKYAP